MAQTFSGTQHLFSSSLPFTAPPFSWMVWVNTSGGQFRRFMAVGKSSDLTHCYNLATDSGSTSNKVASYINNGTAGQTLTSAALTTSAWQHVAQVEASTSSHAAYLSGANKGSNGGTFTAPTGMDILVLSGRHTDFTAGASGQMAHAAVWVRGLSDTELLFLGAGNNPRYVKGLQNYYKLTSGDSPVHDEVGTLDLTASGPPAVGTSDPDFQTFLTGGTVGAQSYTTGLAITSVNLSAGHLFDSVSSAFTVALYQLGAATSLTTTTAPLTAAREVPLTSATGLSAGDYLKVTSGGTPTRVLQVNGLIALVADDQTATSGASVFRFAVSPLSVSGLSISSNVWSGTPTVAVTNNNCVFRATCNGNSALMADSDLFTMTITSGGGGGGSSLLSASGSFSGGFSGG